MNVLAPGQMATVHADGPAAAKLQFEEGMAVPAQSLVVMMRQSDVGPWDSGLGIALCHGGGRAL